ncbi:MAG: hypothetical protein JXD22_08590 [Sedimentisphaerales bacterium]|nr:hypothetical protein [Sedimentisphaerales bacterium]
MKKWLTLVLILGPTFLSGCGAQTALLGTQSTYLFTVMDSLALPAEQVQLKAQLLAGDFLKPQPGYIVKFYQNDKLFKITQTDQHGLASVNFQPSKPGNYRFTAKVHPVGLSAKPPAPRELVVCCREPETPIILVDMDKTIVASGFQTVLIGNPVPMTDSAAVLNDISTNNTLIYLTHRPDYFGPKSKSWLTEHNYPKGPVLMSTVSTFLKGSKVYKSEMIRSLKEKFHNIRFGIGDKISDGLAYHENSITAIVIIQIPPEATQVELEKMISDLEPLPGTVHVVTGWSQIEKIIAGEESYPSSRMIEQIKNVVQNASQ